MFKVVIINPNIPGDYRKSKIVTSNLGISYLSSYIKKHNSCEVKIIDGRAFSYSIDEVYEKIIQFNPDLIGLSLCVDETSAWSRELLKLVKNKKPKVHVTLGNYFPSLFISKAFEQVKYVDSIIFGEGELTISELIYYLQNGLNWKKIDGISFFNEHNQIITNPCRKLIDQLDDLPFPDRYLADKDEENIEAMLEGTRGCCFCCSFCAVRPFYELTEGKRVRIRSAISIFQEIQELCSHFKYLKVFRFVDSEFVTPHSYKRAVEFANLLIDSHIDIHMMMDARASSILANKELFVLLAKAGVTRLYIGIESGSDKILKKMNKGTIVQTNKKSIQFLKENGIDFSYGFMMITPWTMEDDIEENIKILKEIGRIEFRCIYHEMTLIPKTKAFNEVQKTKKMIWQGSLSYYTYQTLSPRVERYRKLCKQLIKADPLYFGHVPGYIYESIRHIRRIGDISLADQLESLSDQLIVEIIETCWENCLDEQEDQSDFIVGLREIIEKKFLKILYMINPNISPIDCQNRVPKHAPHKQI